MIFVGRGALVRRAVDFTAASGYRVDLLCTDDPTTTAGLDVPVLRTRDVNADAGFLERRCSDGIVWSIDNRMIFRSPMLESGLRIYNVHNGLLPQHRGLASAAVLFALLHGHAEYGATLHEVDSGIDTGRVLAERRFPIDPRDRYHHVLLRGVHNCHALFETSLEGVVDGTLQPPARSRASLPAAYYGLRALRDLHRYAGRPDYPRATDLGFLAPFVPEVAAAVADARCRRAGL